MKRSKKEIEAKICELYTLAQQGKIDIYRVILYSDALCYAMGEDYLDFDYLKEDGNDE